MTRHSTMSPELIGILSVGAALAGLILAVASWFGIALSRTDDRFDRMDARPGKVEQSVAILLERTAPLAPAMAKKEMNP